MEEIFRLIGLCFSGLLLLTVFIFLLKESGGLEKLKNNVSRVLKSLFISTRYIEELGKMLTHEDWKTRRDAVKKLQLKNSPSTIELLLKASQDSDERVRYEAVTALQRKIEADEQKDGELFSGFDAESSLKSRIVKMFLNALTDEHPGVRIEATLALGKMQNPKMIKHLTRALKDANGSVRKRAVLGLGKIGTIRVMEPLFNALDDEHEYVRMEAVAVLENLCPLVHTILFGHKVSEEFNQRHTLWNPDVSNLIVPMLELRTVVIHTETYDFHQVERFLTYAVNYIGQKHLKKNVEVHIYGDQEKLHPNLWNNFTNLCKDVQVYRA
jgi:hypothetical protein